MADLKISQLTDGGASQAADEYVVARSGSNFRIDGASVAAAATSVGTLTSLTTSGIGNFTLGGTPLSWSADVGLGITRNGTSGSSASLALSAGNTGAAFLYFGNSTTQQNGALYYDNSTNAMVFQTNGGSEKMRLDASGNLGLGVTPSAWGSNWRVLDSGNGNNGVFGSVAFYASGANGVVLYSNARNDNTNDKYVATAPAAKYAVENNTFKWFQAAQGTGGNNISFTQAMTLDASGNLAVGTTSPTQRLDVRGSIYAQRDTNPTNGIVAALTNQTTASNNGCRISFDAYNVGGASIGIPSSSASLVFYVNGDNTERARITSGGYFKASKDGSYFGSTGPYHELRSDGAAGDWTAVVTTTTASSGNAYGLYIKYTAASPNGTGNQFLLCDDSTATRAVIRSNGGLANYQANNVDLSDARTKTEITPAASMWDKVAALEIVAYKYIDQTHDDVNLGVIAQQVETVEPVWVDVDGFGDTPEGEEPFKTVYTKDITFAAIKALQEAMARIEALETRLEALEA